MPKGRMLNKKISVDEEVAKLSDKAIILYCWSISHLDSEGKMHASNAILKGTVVPYLKRFTHQVIAKAKTELGNSPLVVVYGNGKYMKFIGFEKNQRIDKDREAPSEIPNPTPEELQSKSGATPSEVKLSLSKEKLNSNPNSNIKDFKLFISMFREKLGKPLLKSQMAIISGWWHRGMNNNEAVRRILDRHKDKQAWAYYEKSIWPDYNLEVGQVYKNEPTGMGELLKKMKGA